MLGVFDAYFGYSKGGPCVQWRSPTSIGKCLSVQPRKRETGMERLDRITMDVARMNAEPCIRDLRLTVRRVLEALATYPDRAELKREYPELEDEDIRQALEFAAAYLDDKILPPVAPH